VIFVGPVFAFVHFTGGAVGKSSCRLLGEASPYSRSVLDAGTASLTLFGALVVEIGTGKALVVTYLNPLVAIAFGVLALGERPGAGVIVGLSSSLPEAGSQRTDACRRAPFGPRARARDRGGCTLRRARA